MNEQPSYTAPPGTRWGTGSATVLRYLLRDLAHKPNVPPPSRAGSGIPSLPAHPFR